MFEIIGIGIAAAVIAFGIYWHFNRHKVDHELYDAKERADWSQHDEPKAKTIAGIERLEGDFSDASASPELHRDPPKPRPEITTPDRADRLSVPVSAPEELDAEPMYSEDQQYFNDEADEKSAYLEHEDEEEREDKVIGPPSQA